VPLVSFNLGVELGQIVIAAVALRHLEAEDQACLVSRWVPACSLGSPCWADTGLRSACGFSLF